MNPLIRLLLVLLFVAPVFAAQADDLPLASESPLAGVSFEDRPLILPVQRNFQMALLTVGSELGRTCGKMEAYGWKLSQVEQGRADGIFAATVEKLRAQGYTVEAQAPATASRDVTIFTADRADKHFTFMWSAGEIGLVMVLCENPRGGMSATPAPPVHAAAPSVETFAVGDLGMAEERPARKGKTRIHRKPPVFSPVGAWVGSYSCAQGYTGGTLQISSLHGENFQGTFRFYPTDKNPAVPRGSYHVSGQYDEESQRVLINPGKWIERPARYANTVMVGSFDPATRTFSAYFQGITGCTSFEAHYAGAGSKDSASAKPVKKKNSGKKKSGAAKKSARAAQHDKIPPEPAAAVALPTSPASSSVTGIEVTATPQPAPALQPAPTPGVSTPAVSNAAKNGIALPDAAPAAPASASAPSAAGTPPSPVVPAADIPPPPAMEPASAPIPVSPVVPATPAESKPATP